MFIPNLKNKIYSTPTPGGGGGGGGGGPPPHHAKAHQSNRMGAPGPPAHSGTAVTSRQAPVQ